MAVEGSGLGLPDFRLCALCTPQSCLSPCPMISARAGMFPAPKAKPGQGGPSMNVCGGKGRVDEREAQHKARHWAHMTTPQKELVLVPELPSSARSWGTQGTSERQRAGGKPWTQTADPTTPVETVHRPQMLSPLGPLVPMVGLLLGDHGRRMRTRSGMRHRTTAGQGYRAGTMYGAG